MKNVRNYADYDYPDFKSDQQEDPVRVYAYRLHSKIFPSLNPKTRVDFYCHFRLGWLGHSRTADTSKTFVRKLAYDIGRALMKRYVSEDVEAARIDKRVRSSMVGQEPEK